MLTDLQLCDLAGKAYNAPNIVLAEDVAAYVERDGDRLTIAPRGTTKDPRDWLRDVSASPEMSPAGCKMHSGVLFGARALFEAIVPRYMPRSLPPRELVLTGHSLGGGYAIALAAFFVVLEHLIPAQLVAFEPLRVGFASLARVLSPIDGEFRIYRCGNSPVTGLPPWLPWWPYQQPIAMVQIGQPQFDPIDCHLLAYIRAALVGNQAAASALDHAAIVDDADRYAAAISAI